MTAIRADVAAVLAQIADDIDAQALIAARPGQLDSLERIAKRVRAVYKPLVPCVLVRLPEPDGTAKPDSPYVHGLPKSPYWRLATTGDRLFVADAANLWTTTNPDTARQWLEHDAAAMLAAAAYDRAQAGGEPR